MRDVFDEIILDYGGVRLFVKYEQCCEIVTYGPKRVIGGVLPVWKNKS